jgi:hypothetical protein
MPELPRLIAEAPEAVVWVAQVKAVYSDSPIFGKIAAAVIWSDATGPDGTQLVPLDNPQALAAEINANGFPLLKGHDPGFPVGKVIAAQVFAGTDGSTFIAAIVGHYAGGNHLTFREFGYDPTAVVSPPLSLPALPDGCWIIFATDSREVDEAWVEDVLRTASLPVERTEVSHNAAETLQELIRVGLPYIALVWNPFVKTIATEAGKDAYAALRQWQRDFFAKLAERRNPLVEIQAIQNECHVSFLFRGKDVKRLYAAHDALPLAAVQAAQLIANMKRTGSPPKSIVYEYRPQDDKWFPSHAELDDGRFVTDNNTLIAIEQLPSGLSLGITRSKDKSRLPNVKSSDGQSLL